MDYRYNRADLVCKVLAILLLFLLALAPRIVGIVQQDPQGDELFWNERSSVLLTKLLDGQVSEATSHLGHPGIPAASAMALAKFVNSKLPHKLQTDELAAARIGNAILSAFISPCVFLALLPIAGWAIAFIASVFLALDVQHIAISRIAHVDSSFSIFVILCLGFYFKAVQQGGLKK